MCGIAGIAGEPRSGAQTDVWRMISSLAHRGPDHEDVRSCECHGLQVDIGYRRLRILDLSAAGNQPMTNETGDIWLVYNGELYNHRELRAELEARGHRFRSRSDTETVVHAYEEWGVEALPRFNGMFAFALHDERAGSLVLARDRRGIKPLYYRWDGSSLSFSSELKALLEVGLARPEIDPTALWLFLCLGYVPSPHSIIRGVAKLLPGHYLELRDGSMKVGSYAARGVDILADAREDELAERTVDAVERAVERQLMSDVPIGVFLSGGLDSTIVTGLAGRKHAGPIHTFSAGYTNGANGSTVDARYNDDFLAARRVARDLGTIHHEVVIDNRESLADQFRDLVFQLDEPMVEPVFVTTHHLARRAREEGVPVVLTGDGADELFGGYDRYFAATRLGRYRRIPGLALALPLIEMTPAPPDMIHNARELRYLLAHPSPVQSYLRFTTIFHPSQAFDLLAPDVRASVDTSALHAVVADVLREAPFVDQMAQADLILWVGEHFNPRLDRMTMMHSVEARVPFQDDDVVELALSIPTAMKSAARSRKKLLREAFGDVVPAAALVRPKRSFQAPGRAWLQGGLADGFASLATGGSQVAALFEPEKVRAYARGWGDGTPGDVFAVSALLMATIWAEGLVSRTVAQRPVGSVGGAR
jgi:asparagine synthase (glutamine-hydrolysing)